VYLQSRMLMQRMNNNAMPSLQLEQKKKRKERKSEQAKLVR